MSGARANGESVMRSLVWQLRAESQMRPVELAKSFDGRIHQLLDGAADAVDEFVRLRLRPDWKPISGAPQDGTRLMLWDSVSKRPVFGSWRGDNPAITHYAAEPAGPEVA